MTLAVELGYRVARLLAARRPVAQAGANPRAQDAAAQMDWRCDEMRTHFLANFSPEEVAGKDVLDFGCAEGGLCFTMATFGVGSVAGIDINPASIAKARERAAMLDGACVPTFHLAETADIIPLPDASFDVILCFDVLEHLMSYRSIIPDWVRVLRPGGSVLIWWMPYFHPFGHHLRDYLPMPWAHAFLSERTLLAICERMVDTPTFNPPHWDFDASGARRNRFRGIEHVDYLNGLTIGDFERLARRSGFRIARRQLLPFSGPAPVEAISRMGTKLPRLREFLSAAAVYELRAP